MQTHPTATATATATATLALAPFARAPLSWARRVIDQVRCGLGHAPGPARRTKAAPLAA